MSAHQKPKTDQSSGVYAQTEAEFDQRTKEILKTTTSVFVAPHQARSPQPLSSAQKVERLMPKGFEAMGDHDEPGGEHDGEEGFDEETSAMMHITLNNLSRFLGKGFSLEEAGEFADFLVSEDTDEPTLNLNEVLDDDFVQRLSNRLLKFLQEVDPGAASFEQSEIFSSFHPQSTLLALAHAAFITCIPDSDVQSADEAIDMAKRFAQDIDNFRALTEVNVEDPLRVRRLPGNHSEEIPPLKGAATVVLTLDQLKQLDASGELSEDLQKHLRDALGDEGLVNIMSEILGVLKNDLENGEFDELEDGLDDDEDLSDDPPALTPLSADSVTRARQGSDDPVPRPTVPGNKTKH